MDNKWSVKWWHILLFFLSIAVVLITLLPVNHEASIANASDFYDGVEEPTPSIGSDDYLIDDADDEGKEETLTEEFMSLITSDLDYRLPRFDVNKLKHRRPRLYKGPGHPAFALFYATRNASDQNAYFIATQQIIYRLLWDPHIRSARYPVVVFVLPFVSQRQRDYFSAAGATVRELAHLDFHAIDTEARLDHRYRDVMSKLLFWNQTEFSRIAFLDSDAFPWTNIDNIMSEEVAPRQKCDHGLLSEDEQHFITNETSCDYVFAGVTEEATGSVNAGVMVLRPDELICDMLIQLSHHQELYDNRYPEQGPLTLFYRPDGPFPSTQLSAGWNGGTDRIRDPYKDCYIVHDKIWAVFWSPEAWVIDDFKTTWSTMLAVYESSNFPQLRAEDDKLVDEVPINEGLPLTETIESITEDVPESEQEHDGVSQSDDNEMEDTAEVIHGGHHNGEQEENSHGVAEHTPDHEEGHDDFVEKPHEDASK